MHSSLLIVKAISEGSRLRSSPPRAVPAVKPARGSVMLGLVFSWSGVVQMQRLRMFFKLIYLQHVFKKNKKANINKS